MSSPTQTTVTGQQPTGGNGGAGHDALRWLEASSLPSTSTQTLAAWEGKLRPEWREEKVTIQHRLQPLDIKDVYPHSEIASVLSTAIQLLTEGVEYLRSAVDAFQNEDFMAADDRIQQFRALLPELFCCRTLGDGFGAVVNSLQIALVNHNGVPLELGQMRTVHQVTARVRQQPFLNFDQAVDLVAVLEETGLDVAPRALADLAELGDNG